MSDLRKLPRVDVLAAALDGSRPHVVRVRAARQAIDEARAQLRAGDAMDKNLVERAGDLMHEQRRPALREVINATGVVVHTNLGRAPLSLDALRHAVGYTNLEYDLGVGTRGSRRGLVEPLLLELFEAPAGSAALVTNNNAAAVMLALAALIAPGRDEVIVSRGELVEIGGSFRVPDVLAASGARLVEVGTTNRTYARDYAQAIGAGTAALLRVHPSNYRISGFVARPTVAELAAIADGRPLLVDLGSDVPGPLPAGLDADAERVGGTLSAGADVVCFSGDKVLGGPQCGLVIGRAVHLEAMARHPLMRALRPDKLTLGALEHTLRAYADGEPQRVAVYAMIHLPAALLHARAVALAARIPEAVPIETADPIGGGSHPDVTLAGWGVAIPDASPALAAHLRAADPPIIACTQGKALVLALRTVPAHADDLVASAVNRAIDSLGARR